MPLVTWLKGVFKKNKPSPTDKILAPIEEQLEFATSRHLTLGVEFEVGVLDANTYRVVHDAASLISTIKRDNLHLEGAQHVLELVTGVCERVQQAETDLQAGLQDVIAAANQQGRCLSGTGRMTLFTEDEFRLSEGSDRYQMLRERRQVMFDRFNCMQGMHMHFGMRSADECMRYHNFFIHFLPHLLALSASTPFENGVDTGLATIRPVVAEAMPFAGLPYPFVNWDDYKNLCRVMAKSDAIRSLKDLWWDLRPCPRFGTLEVRVCDQPATLAEGLAITAFMYVLAHWFEEHHSWLDEMPRPSGWRLRENKWRTMRYGLDAELVVNNQGETRPIKTDILLWLERTAPYIARYKYEPYIQTLRDMLARGNSTQRQRRVLALTGDMKEVAAFNVRELHAGAPLWDELDEMERAKASANTATEQQPAPLYAGVNGRA